MDPLFFPPAALRAGAPGTAKEPRLPGSHIKGISVSFPYPHATFDYAQMRFKPPAVLSSGLHIFVSSTSNPCFSEFFIIAFDSLSAPAGTGALRIPSFQMVKRGRF